MVNPYQSFVEEDDPTYGLVEGPEGLQVVKLVVAHALGTSLKKSKCKY